ncbi:20862_t:CDS:1 [Cetraspora pellucida]|uniref:20862_t:CDS:1 n=1 Tax=Cetraspora pellucida TaxID=1433469 RepID=A0A9N9GJM1_9GLOM|nr:20862_t:CDS:1 [Cetraspora pellucida]
MSKVQSRGSYAPIACTNCKRKHAKCSGEVPCMPCKEKNLKCWFKPGKKRGPKERPINKFNGAQFTEQYNNKSEFCATECSIDFLANNLTLIHPYNNNVPIMNYNTHDSFNFVGGQSSQELQQQNGIQEIIYGVFIMPLAYSQNISLNGDYSHEFHENNLTTVICPSNYNSVYPFDHLNSSNLFNNQSTTIYNWP